VADEPTRLPDDETDETGFVPSRRPPSARTAAGSDRPRSSASHHGRFEAGTVIGDRFRVVARLGTGGMGEVYLADDLVLDQPVALKFFAESLAVDSSRLARLHDEVRIARQVSHPNVCRVHDIGEANGLHFLSMEFIPGEDLAALLKRVGRLPEERGLEVARQICAGVAAAHARGVLHLDLKPANVMLDADGHVRISDFGLAVAGGAAEAGIEGTPAYMAPEQLAGTSASVASDIFAVGLVLYELFTGRRAFEAGTVADLRRQHEFRTFARPSELVPGLAPAIERTILACLEPEPANRLKSALAVAAALPGGDPLAAALDAGETPSPEMVAAAGGEAATVSPAAGLTQLALLLAMLAAILALADRALLLNRMAMALAPDVLSDRASSIEHAVALGAAVTGRAFGFDLPTGAGRPADTPIVFWQRTSPGWLVASGYLQRRPSPVDPPLDTAGSTLVTLDLRGRLLDLLVVPPADDRDRPLAPVDTDWRPLFGAAELPIDGFGEVPPQWTPSVFADSRKAWSGTRPGDPGELRVEAATLRGHVVSFRVRQRQSTLPADAPAARGTVALVAFVATAIVLPLSVVGSVVLARRNLQRGRGDRRGAWRLATTVSGLSMLAWALTVNHVPSADAELSRVAAGAGQALLSGALLALLYLALEPHARRIWPQVLIAWSRLTIARFPDPVVGRDVLAGALAGALMTLITFAHYRIPSLVGGPEFAPATSNLAALLGTREVTGVFADILVSALFNALLGVTGLVAMRLLTRRRWPSYALATTLFAFLAARGQFETGIVALDLGLGALLVVIVLGAMFRFGLVAGIAAFFVHMTTLRVPTTLDPSRPYFETGLAVIALVFGLGVLGFWMARAKEPLLGRWAGEP
jgi:tRNA A-37 threonylcarbamoyl transferase component Bud32